MHDWKQKNTKYICTCVYVYARMCVCVCVYTHTKRCCKVHHLQTVPGASSVLGKEGSKGPRRPEGTGADWVADMEVGVVYTFTVQRPGLGRSPEQG